MTRTTLPPLRIAAAQSTSVAGNVAANVRLHTQFIAAAHQAGVDVLVFPELSLSGYELALLHHCLVQPDDHRLTPIRDLVRTTGMTVVVGAPVLQDNRSLPCIAALTFFQDGTSSVYCKQHLHPGEERYASPGDTGSQCYGVGDASYALAICADTSHASHAQAAAATGASLYLAGVLVSEAGYATDSSQLAHNARQFNLGVLMANHGGPSGGYVSAGKSAFWAPGGALVVAAPGTGNGLVIATRHADQWHGEWLAVHTYE
jgi:predicted amidohydrolase